jgi:hypothetical protein
VDDSFRFSSLLRFYDFLKSWPGVTITSLSLFSSPFAGRFCVYVFHFSFSIFNIVLSFEFRVSTVTNFHCILLFATVRDFVFCCLQLWLARILLFARILLWLARILLFAEYYGSLNASTEANNYIRGNRETRIER